ncbi:phage tail tip fiber protein [Enterobacter hormaechei]
MLVVPDRFAVMAQGGGAVSLSVVIEKGNWLIQDRFIEECSIINYIILTYFQSFKWDGNCNFGCKINNSGYEKFNKVTVRVSIYGNYGNF